MDMSPPETRIRSNELTQRVAATVRLSKRASGKLESLVTAVVPHKPPTTPETPVMTVEIDLLPDRVASSRSPVKTKTPAKTVKVDLLPERKISPHKGAVSPAKIKI